MKPRTKPPAVTFGPVEGKASGREAIRVVAVNVDGKPAGWLTKSPTSDGWRAGATLAARHGAGFLARPRRLAEAKAACKKAEEIRAAPDVARPPPGVWPSTYGPDTYGDREAGE